MKSMGCVHEWKMLWMLTAMALGVSSCVSEQSETTDPGSAEESADHSATADAPVAPNRLSVLGLEFVRVPAGTFLMGAVPGDDAAEPSELPQHEVKLTRGFEVATTEVTVGQFRAFVEATGYKTEAELDPKGGWIIDPATNQPEQKPGVHWRNCGFEQDENHPVVQVSWVDAEAFCAWLSEHDGRRYGLPTEAQWEYVCRAGTTGRYWFGDEPFLLVNSANIGDLSLNAVSPVIEGLAKWDDGASYTAPVGQRAPNPWGLHDVNGNVWEWCADWHDPAYYVRSPRVDPQGPKPGEGGPDVGKMRSIRGGGWYDGPERQRSSQRAWFFPVFRSCQLSGFRVVRDL